MDFVQSLFEKAGGAKQWPDAARRAQNPEVNVGGGGGGAAKRCVILVPFLFVQANNFKSLANKLTDCAVSVRGLETTVSFFRGEGGG